MSSLTGINCSFGHSSTTLIITFLQVESYLLIFQQESKQAQRHFNQSSAPPWQLQVQLLK